MKGLEILNNLNNLIEEAITATSEENLGDVENELFNKHLEKIKKLNTQAEAELKAWNTDRYIYLLQVITERGLIEPYDFLKYDAAVIIAVDTDECDKLIAPHFEGTMFSTKIIGKAERGSKSEVVLLRPNADYTDH